MQVGELFVRLHLDTASFNNGLNEAQGKLKSVGDKMTSAGKTLTKTVTAPIVGIATASVATVAKFNDSMSRVQAISGATGEDFERLRQTAQDMGAATRFSASESADALTYLALAGWDVNKSIEALPKVLRLAQAGGMDLAYTSDLVTDSMSALGLEFAELDNFVDQLATTSQRSNTSVAQLGEGILAVGGTAKVLAGGTTELNTVLGILADNGIKGAEGGTALRNMILSLTAPTDKARGLLQDFDIAVTDASGNLRPLNEIFSEMDHKLGALSDTEKTAFLSEIFNKVDLKSVNALMGTTNERFEELSGAIENSAGSAELMADTMENNIAGAFRALKSQLEGILIQIGDVLEPLITEKVIPALQGFGQFVSEVIDKFNGLDESTQMIILAIIAFLAALGPVLIILGTLISTVAKVIAIKGTLAVAFAALTGPIGIAIVAITALIAIGVALWKNWDEIKANAQEAWDNIRNKISETSEKIKQIIENMKTAVQNTWNDFTERLKNIWDSMWDNIRNIVQNAWGRLSGAFNNLFNSIQSWFMNLPNRAMQWGKNMIQGFIDGINNMIGAVGNAVSNVTGTVGKWLGFRSPSEKGEGRFITQWGENMIGGFMDGIENAIPALQSTLDSVIPAMGGSGTTQNNFGGVTVQNMTVRNDSDIELVARRLYDLQTRTGRGLGIV